MPKYRILIAEFRGNGTAEYETEVFIRQTQEKIHFDPLIGREGIFYWNFGRDTPITKGRNRALMAAEKNNIDYVLMVDSDQAPDMYVGKDPKARPFWDTAWEFVQNHNGPCAVFAPYCGKPPYENVFVFRWTNFQSDCPDRRNFNIEQYTRFEAAARTGIEQVASGPTGCCLLDMRAIKWLKHPRFYYEWKDETHCDMASTEDVTFFRDLNYAGCPVHCLWDCWAGHWKPKLVGKPEYCDPKDIEFRLSEGVLYEAAKRLNIPDSAVKQQLEYMRRRPDEVEKL